MIYYCVYSQEVQVLGLSPLQDAHITFLCPNNLVCSKNRVCVI